MATPPPSDADAAEFVGQLFFWLWRAAHTQFSDALEALGLTTATFGLLNLLVAREGAKQQELGAAMAIDPSTMVSLIDELEAAGLAKRRPHPDDRRARAVVLTPKGRRVVQKARRLATQVEGDVLHGLTESERTQLVTLLRRALESAPPQSPWRAEEGD